MRMGISDELAISYRVQHPGLFPEGEDLAAIEAGAKSMRVGSKKRCRQSLLLFPRFL